MVYIRAQRGGAIAAFTLVEIITVIAIVSILTAIMIGAGRYTVQAGELARAKAELAALSAGLEVYAKKYGDYPQTNAPELLLQSLLGKRGPDGDVLHDRPLIDLSRLSTSGDADPLTDTSAALVDPWSQPYRYRYYANGAAARGFELYSTGPDQSGGSTGGPDNSENADNVYAGQ